MEVIRGTLGEFVPLRIKIRERRSDAQNGRAFDVNGIRIASITRPDGTLIAAGSIPAFAFVNTGEYVAQWDTSGETQVGPYTMRCQVTIGWDTVAAKGITAPKNFLVQLGKAGGIP